jgi:PAS domain S-box-containing protein
MNSKPSYEQLKQKVKALTKESLDSKRQLEVLQNKLMRLENETDHASYETDNIRVSGINIEWQPVQGTCTFESLPVAMMWVDTTLAGLMAGVQAMVGTKRFGLALQSEGRKSVEADWQVISSLPDFKGGFKAIANIAAVAGWGDWKLVSLDKKKKRCRFQVKNSWEGNCQKALGVYWGSGILAGKMAGYCSKLFETNCWAEQTASIAKGDKFDEFVVAPSKRYLEKEVESLLATDEATRADMAVVLEKMNQEITVRRETEEKLAESEKMLDSIISSVPDIIYRLDPQGRITFISQTVTEYGYVPADLIGQSIYDIVHPEDRDSVRSRIDERRTGNRRTRNLEVRFMNKLIDAAAPNKANSGYSVFLLGAEGLYEARDDQSLHFIGTQGIVRDITERKQLESQLQQAQKMEAIGTLAGGIAHDFNNILATIIGYAEMIEMFDVPNNDKVRERLKYILASAYRAKDLVQQILTFSRRTEQDKVPVTLAPILKDIIKFLRASLPATIKINARYEDNSSVLGDSTQLYQVMMNLCTNAAHAMGEKGGILEVNLSDVHFDSIDSGLQAELEPRAYIMVGVQDTGDGMTPDMLDRIFEPFFTTKRRGEGTGLGLSVVHGIVKGMGGAISVHSQMGEGSLFQVFLPRYEGRKDQPVSEKFARIVRGKGRILFIDDEQPLVDFAREMLIGLGYEVVALTSSPEALEQFSQQPNTFDLVIADLTMPDLTGLELAEAIMGLRPDIPVILCTGFADPAMAEKARKMGIAEVIKKPFGVQDFAESIRRVLDK